MSTRERFSMWNQLYWVARSYVNRKILWVFIGWYVLLFFPLWIIALLSGRSYSDLSLLPIFAQLGLVALLWLQFRAQAVTTICSVVPRFWLPHQLVFLAIAFAVSSLQACCLTWMNVDSLAAMAISGVLFIPWAVLQVLHMQIAAAYSRKQYGIANIIVGLTGMGMVVAFLWGPILLSDRTMDLFLSGAFPRLSLFILSASIISLAIIVGRMPYHHRTYSELTNRLPPIDFSPAQWNEWNMQNMPAAKEHKIDRRFSKVTPGCVVHDDRKRAALTRKANPLTGMNFLASALAMCSSIWVMNYALFALIIRKYDFLSITESNTPMLCMTSLMPLGILFMIWDQRRRTMVVELMRPVTRATLFRDLFKAIGADTLIFCLVQSLNIIGYAVYSGQALHFSIPAVTLRLASWCLIPTSILILLSYPKNRHALVFGVVILAMFIGVETVLMDTQFHSVLEDRYKPQFEFVAAIATTLVLIAFFFTAKSRWSRLEWDA
ncbi:MAG: hypothetical protein ACKVT0_14260 [Planctomycetaceae bacterium]